jgi:hypothetical protein
MGAAASGLGYGIHKKSICLRVSSRRAPASRQSGEEPAPGRPSPRIAHRKTGVFDALCGRKRGEGTLPPRPDFASQCPQTPVSVAFASVWK